MNSKFDNTFIAVNLRTEVLKYVRQLAIGAARAFPGIGVNDIIKDIREQRPAEFRHMRAMLLSQEPELRNDRYALETVATVGLIRALENIDEMNMHAHECSGELYVFAGLCDIGCLSERWPLRHREFRYCGCEMNPRDRTQ